MFIIQQNISSPPFQYQGNDCFISSSLFYFKFCLTLFIALCSIEFVGAQDIKDIQAECLNLKFDGYVTIRIWDTKKGVRYKLVQARKDALYTMLYAGISGNVNCTSQPPILTTAKTRENFVKFKEAFFSENGDWKLYTTSSTNESLDYTKFGKKKIKIYEVSINKGGLKKYLEEQNVIKKLNDGF